jgi:hypothetical protein
LMLLSILVSNDKPTRTSLVPVVWSSVSSSVRQFHAGQALAMVALLLRTSGAFRTGVFPA